MQEHCWKNLSFLSIPGAPEVPTNACLMVTSSTALTVTFQEPLSVNAAVVTKYKGTVLQGFFTAASENLSLENQLCIFFSVR